MLIAALSLFRDAQHLFSDQIVTYFEAIKAGHAVTAYLGLAFIGFVYGIVHAVGPGHGKMVVSSYVLANENSLKRGLLIVLLSSLVQAIVAIVIVLGFYLILAKTRTEAEHAASVLEIGSFGLIGLIGLRLMLQGLKNIVSIFRTKPSSHKHVHTRDHSSHSHAHAQHDHAHDDNAHDHHSHEDHVHDEHCGHAHMPSPEDMKGHKDMWSMALMIFSIGIRPCTGALLLLFFACIFDLALPGILATFTMSIGTAVTTGALAILAVKSKHLATAFVKRSDHGLAVLHAGLRLGGGLVIVLTAGFFLLAQISTDPSAPITTEQHPLYKALP